MSCCHYYTTTEHGDPCFSIDAANVTFGNGALHEGGDHARALGCTRVALFTDPTVGKLEPVAHAAASLRAAGIDVALYDQVQIEPSDRSFMAAAQFAREGRFDGFVSVGGGSVIDTCKAAILYSSHPADFLAYVNKPVGERLPVPGPLKPHIACPTTSGTGSECTGITGVGYGGDDIAPLVDGAAMQTRLLSNAPRAVDRPALDALFRAALSYW